MRFSGEIVAGGFADLGELIAGAGGLHVYVSAFLLFGRAGGPDRPIGRAGNRPCDGTVSYVGMADLSGRPRNV